jgi:SAM-dependent methyltransferase
MISAGSASSRHVGNDMALQEGRASTNPHVRLVVWPFSGLCSNLENPAACNSRGRARESGVASRDGEAGQMRKTSVDREHWARVASAWIAWARSPNHDVFWAYRKSLVDFIGPGDGKALDVGCGEGRVSRELKALGYQVTASDVVAEMIEAAVTATSAHHYAVADAAALPFSDGSFDLVVAYNMLMDVEDVLGTLKEIRRVMRSNGELVVSLVHPFRDRGDFASAEPDAPFIVRGSYFGRQRFEGSEQRSGLRMNFAGWSQPLEAYAAALEEAGLAITSLREPVPENGDQQNHRVPLFLWLRARPLAS